MPVITVEVECPACGDVFDLKEFDTTDDEQTTVDCPECAETLIVEYDASTGEVELFEIEGESGVDMEDEDEDEGQEEL